MGEKSCKQIAHEVIVSYLNHLGGTNAVIEIVEISSPDNGDKVLLEHIKAMKSIFEEAIKEIENG